MRRNPNLGETWPARTQYGYATIHHAIAAMTDRQYGPITREQLIDVGLSEDQIDYRIASGEYFVRYPTVYTIGGRDLSERGEWSAAVLAAGDGAYLSFEPAGVARGLLTRYEGPIHVTVSRSNAPELDGVTTHVATFGPWETGSCGGIPTTTTARTLFDLARVLSTRDLIRAFHRALKRGVSISQLDRMLKRHKGERGTRILRQLVELHRPGDGVSNGGFEDAFWPWLLKLLPNGHPRPKRNQHLELSDGTWAEADIVIGNVIIELHHFDHHGADRAQTTADDQRDRSIRNDGWRLERFTSDEFALDRARVERDVRRLLGLPPR